MSAFFTKITEISVNPFHIQQKIAFKNEGKIKTISDTFIVHLYRNLGNMDMCICQNSMNIYFRFVHLIV